jgi:hypothetical protein
MNTSAQGKPIVKLSNQTLPELPGQYRAAEL